jgi:hypothetical protein
MCSFLAIYNLYADSFGIRTSKKSYLYARSFYSSIIMSSVIFARQVVKVAAWGAVSLRIGSVQTTNCVLECMAQYARLSH